MTEWQYNWKDQVSNIVHKLGATTLASFRYDRASGGEPTRVTREDGTFVELQYDAALRLTNEVYKNLGGTVVEQIGYGYDASGSRVRFVKGGNTLTNAVTAGYRITQVKNGAAVVESYSYDNGGRVTGMARDGVTRAFGYNSADQLTAVTNGAAWVTYRHDANGRRTVSTNSAGTVRRLLVAPTPGADLESPLLVANVSGTVQQGYVYLGDEPLLRFDAAGTAVYYLEDAMGSVAALANGSGAKIASFNYDGFGNVRSQSGTTASPTGTGGDFRFHGAWLEEGSGLYNMRAREYDPRLGRFTSKDRDRGNTETPESLHPYNFADCNPCVYSDPSGEFTLVEINLTSGLQTTLQTIRAYGVKKGRDKAFSTVSNLIQDWVMRGIRAYMPIDLTALSQGLKFEQTIRQIVCNEIGEIGGYFYFATPVRPSGDPIRSGVTCGDVDEETGKIFNERKGVNNREVGAWMDLIISSESVVRKNGEVPKAWIAMEFKGNTKTVVNDYFQNPKKRRQLDSTLNYAVRHTYPRTAVILVGMYDRQYNRNTFPQFEKRIQMTAVRKGGFAYVDVVTDIGRKK